MQDRLIRIVFVAYASIIFLTAVTTSLVFVHFAAVWVSSGQVDDLTGRARLLGELSGPAVFRTTGSPVIEQVRALGRESGTRYTLVTLSGAPLVDSQVDVSQLPNQFERPELLEARVRGVGSATNSVGLEHQAVTAAAVAVLDQGQTAGFVRAEQPRRALAVGATTLYAVLAGIIVAALLSGLLWVSVTRGFTRDLEMMDRTIQAVLSHSDWTRRRRDG